MEHRHVVCLALVSLLGFAAVAQCTGDTGSSLGGGNLGGSLGGSLGGGLGGSTGSRSGMTLTGSSLGTHSVDALSGTGMSSSSSSSSSSERSSRTVDRWGGYFDSDRYYWNGGYWDGGCYGCGIWICIGCNYPECPACQWFNKRTWRCEYAETCASGVLGRKLLAMPAQHAAA
ncbi:g10672 [Coccomyxa elongata]